VTEAFLEQTQSSLPNQESEKEQAPKKKSEAMTILLDDDQDSDALKNPFRKKP